MWGQIAGAAIGGLLSSQSGGDGQTTTDTTSRVAIPPELRGVIGEQTRNAAGALGNIGDFYGRANADDLVADLSPDQLASMEMGRSYAGLDGSRIGGPGAAALHDTAAGDFLFGGEGFNAAVGAAMRDAQPRVLSAFGGAGRADSGLAQAAMQQQAVDAFAGQYQQERANQLNAARSLDDMRRRGMGLLQDQGALQRQFEQQRMLAPVQAQEHMLNVSGGAVNPAAMLGSDSSSTQTVPTMDSWERALQGAAGGAMIGSKFNNSGSDVADGLSLMSPQPWERKMGLTNGFGGVSSRI